MAEPFESDESVQTLIAEGLHNDLEALDENGRRVEVPVVSIMDCP